MSNDPNCVAYLADQDATVLAQELKRVGLIRNKVVEHLTKLSPQVPNLMKHRYLFSQVYAMIKTSEKAFMRVVEALLHYPVKPVTTEDHSNTLICSEHIPDIVEILANYATKWRFIGTALRFLPQELDYIEGCVGRRLDSPKRGLLLLLQKWIFQESKHALPTTLKNLNYALNSQLVGLGALADKVSEVITVSFAGKTNTAYQPLKYVISSVDLCLNRTESIYATQCQNMQLIEAKENESVLFEVQNTTTNRSVMALEYQWQVNRENICVDGALARPFLYVEADMCKDNFQYSCSLQMADFCNMAKIPKVVRTYAITLRVSTPLDSFRDGLVSMYLNQPEVPIDSWPSISSKKYVNLAIIKQEKIDYMKSSAQFTIQGDLDDILKDKEMIQYGELVTFLKSGTILFIEGRPGSGKTTFVHKIMHDWALSPQDFSRTIRSLFLVSLRVLNTFNKPLELSDILHLFKKVNVSKRLIEEREGKGVCFIFDGLDEFSPQDGEDSIVFKIIKKEYLSKSIVIVASRPVATAHLRSKASKVIEVLGFQENQIFEYFNYYPFSDSSKPAELNDYLTSHPNILHMCYLPIHAVMVAFLFEVTGSVPRTETEIYTHFTRFTVMRSVSKDTDLKGSITDIECLGKKQEFDNICLLASNKMILNEQVLHQNDVNLVSGDEQRDACLGLLTVDCTAGLYGYANIYTFLHLTFQEYLAAHYISTLSHKEQMKLIQNHGHKVHMSMVWKFFCGLVKFDVSTKDNRFQHLLQKIENGHLFHIQCAFESQQDIVCTQVLKKVEYHINIRGQHHISIPDFTAVGFLASRSTLIPTKLTIDSCNISTGALNALAAEMKQNVNLIKLEVIKSLRKNQLFKDELVLLLRQCTHLKDLNISFNQFTDADATTISEVLENCRNLEKIVISYNSMTSKGVQELFRSFKNTIDFNDIKPQNYWPSAETPSGVHLPHTKNFLGAAMMSHTHYPQPASGTVFSTVPCARNQYSDSDLLSALIKWPELKSLSFYIPEDTCIIDQCGENWQRQIKNCPSLFTFCECLQRAPKIQTLVIRAGVIGSNSLHLLVDFLNKCRQLQVLDLSSNDIEDSTVQMLFKKLDNRNELLELNLENNKINCKNFTWIQNFIKLQRLNLSNNKLKSKCCTTTSISNLQSCPDLLELNLDDNYIGTAGVVEILKCCNNLQLSFIFETTKLEVREQKHCLPIFS